MHSAIKDSRAPRTNHFSVDKQIRGLVEKFRIVNNDELADALYERFVDLSSRNLKWCPEILLLLLQLSENPVIETRLEDLELLERPRPPPPLTWAQLLAEDPLGSDDGLWDNVSFGGGTSEDDDGVTSDRSPSIRAQPIASDADDQSLTQLDHGLEAPTDPEILQTITRGQFWNRKSVTAHEDGVALLTETQVIREVVFMLLGLPTTIFESNSCGLADEFRIKFTSPDTLGHIFQSFTSVGHRLTALRKWVIRSNMIPMVETLQASLSAKLRDFDLALSRIESQILDPVGQMPVTLLVLHYEVQRLVQPLLRVFSAVCECDTQAVNHQFKVLDSLYSLICSSESLDDVVATEYYANFFLPCLRTYLNPVHLWMETGELDCENRVFFVKRQKYDPAMTCLWPNQYELIQDENGSLQAPHFMATLVQQVFNAGRSVSFLRSLGLYTDKPYKGAQPMPPFEFRIDHGKAQPHTFSSFSECFTSKLGAWVTDHHRQSSLSLREAMASRCGLWNSLDALEHIYFSRNGALTNQIAAIIFERIDQGACSWNDPFILTERFRDVYGQLSCVNADQLAVHTARSSDDKRQSSSRSMECLATICISYKVPWAVANVILQESVTTYQRIGIELLQLFRAKYLLERKSSDIFREEHVAKGSAAIAIALRHRLLCFLNTLHSYLTMTLSEASLDMRAKIETSNDMDKMIAIHKEFISRLQYQCLLSKRHVSTYQAIVSVLDLTVLFSDLCKPSGQPASTKDHPAQILQRRSVGDSDGEDMDTMGALVHEKLEAAKVETLNKMSRTFSRLFGFILAGLREVCRSGAEASLGILLESMAMYEGSRGHV